MGQDEIRLVRKKLNWNYEPFKIPDKILNAWRDIGNKASIAAEKSNSKENGEIKNTIPINLSEEIE